MQDKGLPSRQDLTVGRLISTMRLIVPKALVPALRESIYAELGDEAEAIADAARTTGRSACLEHHRRRFEAVCQLMDTLKSAGGSASDVRLNLDHYGAAVTAVLDGALEDAVAALEDVTSGRQQDSYRSRVINDRVATLQRLASEVELAKLT